MQTSGRLGFRRSRKKAGWGWRCPRLSSSGSGGVRRGPRPPLAADRVASWVDIAWCAATRRLPRARTCCGQTLSAVCMAGGAGTDNGPEVESRLVLGLSILRRSSSSSSRPTTSPCKVRLPCARRPPALCEPSRSASVLARAPTVPRAGVAGASGEVAVGDLRRSRRERLSACTCCVSHP